MNTLEEMVGDRIFRFVPKMDLINPDDADSNGVMFGLDNYIIVVYEDPQDGYRSSLGPIAIVDSHQQAKALGYDNVEYLNISVTCAMEGSDPILHIRDKRSKQIIFAIGTANSDDYYPYFEARWQPNNLHVNSGIDKTLAHQMHCYQGEYDDTCKYGDTDCPANIGEPISIAALREAATSKARVIGADGGVFEKSIAQPTMNPLQDYAEHALGLARRCEDISLRGDSDLDCNISAFVKMLWNVNNDFRQGHVVDIWNAMTPIPARVQDTQRFTSDINAALGLVPSMFRWELTNVGYEEGKCLLRPLALLYDPFSSGTVSARGSARNEASSICAAVFHGIADACLRK